MKRYFLSGVMVLSLVIPVVSLAQSSDVDTSGNAACAVISVNLRYGSRDASTGGAVSILQDFLNSHGYLSVQPTGFFGSMTRAAVAAFQNANGISATPPGFVGPLTRARIQAVDCDNATSVTPPVVNPVQQPTPLPVPSPTPTQSPSPSVYLYANPTSILSDGKPGTITLYWSSSNATYCNFEKSKLSPSGSMVVSLFQTTTYTISCTGFNGANSSNAVTVPFQLTQQLPTVDLKVNSSDGPLAKTADHSTFSWTSNNSDYCTASGDTYWSGTKSTSGSETVWTGNEKTGVTTYSITCGASSGKTNPVTDSVTVNFTY